MSSAKVSLFFFSFFCFLLSATNAINITEVLNRYSDYSTFNNYLTQTQVANAINSRHNETLTVLVVNNGNMGVVSGLPMDTIKSLLSLHVLFDYFDLQKLKNLPNNTVHATSLYQSSGQASNERGFLNATILGGDVLFMSAASGSSVNSKVIKNVYVQPYNFAVLEISNLITPPGLSGSNSSSNSSVSPPAPTNSTRPASSPTKSPTPPVSPGASNSSIPAPSTETSPPADVPSASGKSSAAAVASGIKSATFATVLASTWFWVWRGN